MFSNIMYSRVSTFTYDGDVLQMKQEDIIKILLASPQKDIQYKRMWLKQAGINPNSVEHLLEDPYAELKDEFLRRKL